MPESIAALLLAVVTIGAIWAPGFALASVVRWPSHLLAIAVPLGCALAGLAAFGAWFASPGFGQFACAAILVCSLAVLVARRPDLEELGRPLALSIAIAFLYLSVAGDHGGLDRGNELIANRYWQVTDNFLPQLFAHRLMLGREYLQGFLFKDWLSSDRPPLQSGMMMLVYPWASEAYQPILGLLTGLACNLLWVFGVWSFLRALDLTKERATYIIAGCALVGPVFFSTVYVWPKFLAASLGLSAFALVFSKEALTTKWMAVLGALFALAFLAHGAIAFGIIGVLPFLLHRKPSQPSALLVLVLAFAALYLPWMVYQHEFAPPGDRLAKWHLAGQIPITSDSFLEVMKNAYSQPIEYLLRAKWSNLKVLIGIDAPKIEHPFMTWSYTAMGRMRQASLLYVGVAPALALAGVPFLFMVRRERAVRITLGLALSTAVAFCLLEYGGNTASLAWLHHGPYSLVLLWVAAGFLGASYYPRMRPVLLALAALFFILNWVISTAWNPLVVRSDVPARDMLMTGVAAISIACLLILALHTGRSSSEASDPDPRMPSTT